MCNRLKEEGKGKSGRATTPEEIREMARRALARARKLADRARAHDREAAIIVREATKLEANFEKLVVLIDGGFSTTLIRRRNDASGVVKKGGNLFHRRRRRNRHKQSLTAKVCGNVQLFGRPQHRRATA